jgi:hypothetical protein
VPACRIGLQVLVFVDIEGLRAAAGPVVFRTGKALTQQQLVDSKWGDRIMVCYCRRQ